MTNLPVKLSPAIIREILDIVHNAVFLTGAGNRLLFANSRMAKMFATTPQELVGLPFDQLFLPEDREIMVPNIVKLTKDRLEFETDAMLRCRDGSVFLGLLSCVFCPWEGEEMLAVTIHDISKMKAIERSLKRSERIAFLGRMLDDISHQIRNPVQVIGGLARRLGGGVEGRNYAETIVSESVRLEMLLDTLHTFLALPRPRLKQLHLGVMMSAVDHHLQPVAAAHGGQWSCRCDPGLAEETILVDLPLLLRALEAVVVNACESYPPGAEAKPVTVWLTAASAHEGWPYAITIADRGQGISPALQAKVTAHFFTKKTRHIGMGLTFAQRILEEQDGELAIASREGEGSTITFLLKKERRRPLRTVAL